MKNNIEQEREDIQLIEKVAGERLVSGVFFSNNEVKIYTVLNRRHSSPNLVRYPYRRIVLNREGVWEKTGIRRFSFEHAYIAYLQHKYLGRDSQFVEFAIRMLDIPKVEYPPAD
jgi:hypothetical protein